MTYLKAMQKERVSWLRSTYFCKINDRGREEEGRDETKKVKALQHIIGKWITYIVPDVVSVHFHPYNLSGEVAGKMQIHPRLTVLSAYCGRDMKNKNNFESSAKLIALHCSSTSRKVHYKFRFSRFFLPSCSPSALISIFPGPTVRPS